MPNNQGPVIHQHFRKKGGKNHHQKNNKGVIAPFDGLKTPEFFYG
jgi:hypothetical protein